MRNLQAETGSEQIGAHLRKGKQGMTDDPCTEILMNLHRVLENDTPERLCASIREHLQTCASCSERYKALEQLIRLCKRFPEEQMLENQKRQMKEELRKIVFSHGKQGRKDGLTS